MGNVLAGDIFQSPLGRIFLGIIKLALASFLVALVSTFNTFGQDINIGGITIPIGTILTLIIAFFPILLLLSALRDLGVRL